MRNINAQGHWMEQLILWQHKLIAKFIKERLILYQYYMWKEITPDFLMKFGALVSYRNTHIA